MRCPECGVEMRVQKRTPEQGGLRLAFACRSPQCPRCGQIVAERWIGESAPLFG